MIDFSKMTKKDVGKCFDYFIGPKDTTEAIIRKECKTAIEYNVKAFCFSSSIWSSVVAEELKGAGPLLSTTARHSVFHPLTGPRSLLRN